MTTLSLSLNEIAWQYSCDKANATASTTHTAAQALLPEGERVAFVPQTWQAYAQARISDIEASYAKQAGAEHDTFILAAEPIEKARIAKILAQPQQVKDQFAAQVDAL